MERRTVNRCPVCQGPAVEDSSAPEGVRCRRSTCTHNHSDVKCPRCDHKDLESVSFENKAWKYTCRECVHSWSVAEAKA